MEDNETSEMHCSTAADYPQRHLAELAYHARDSEE